MGDRRISRKRNALSMCVTSASTNGLETAPTEKQQEKVQVCQNTQSGKNNLGS